MDTEYVFLPATHNKAHLCNSPCHRCYFYSNKQLGSALSFSFLSSCRGGANANVHSISERIQREEIWFHVFRLAALKTVQNTAVERADEVQLVGAGSGLCILQGKRVF